MTNTAKAAIIARTSDADKATVATLINVAAWYAQALSNGREMLAERHMDRYMGLIARLGYDPLV